MAVRWFFVVVAFMIWWPLGLMMLAFTVFGFGRSSRRKRRRQKIPSFEGVRPVLYDTDGNVSKHRLAKKSEIDRARTEFEQFVADIRRDRAAHLPASDQ